MSSSVFSPVPELGSNQVKGLITSVGKTLATLPRPAFRHVLIELERANNADDFARVLAAQDLGLPDNATRALVAAVISEDWERLRGRLLLAMTHARADRMWPGS